MAQLPNLNMQGYCAMRTSLLTTAAILISFTLGWAARDYKSELLTLHERDLQAHLKTDVNMLSPAADPFVTVSDGKIEKVNPAQERAFFTDYFRNAKYPQYEDAEPPIIGVSKDGTLGYVISRIRAHRLEKDVQGKPREGRFVYAGIMVYEKRGGEYVRVANVSTFERQ
ncbi:MAG TPA: hypothetical protein VD837_01340 [Terriglobales bacterium]|nr:hypothetical protein [Terriglobales bacterium]